MYNISRNNAYKKQGFQGTYNNLFEIEPTRPGASNTNNTDDTDPTNVCPLHTPEARKYHYLEQDRYVHSPHLTPQLVHLLFAHQPPTHKLATLAGMSALTRNRTTQTMPNDLMLEYYVQRARGGAGLIVSEGTLITRQGTEWPAAPGLWDRSQIAGWRKITDAVHAAGSKMYAQLSHGGRANHPDAPEQVASGVPVYAPSAIAARGGKFRFIPGEPGYVVPTVLPDPTTIVAEFKQAAINAKEAGFDGVELHGASGYLVNQFLDFTSNHRTDKWGGSAANRARFAIETLKALKEVWGSDVAIKLSPAGGHNDVGMPLPDTIETFGYLLREVEKLGLAYVALVRYNPARDPMFDGKPRGTPHDVLATFRPFLLTTPIFINGGVTPGEAESLMASGSVAGVFMGSTWISHPDVARRIKAGRPLDNVVDFAHLYGKEGVDPAVGYLDYAEAVY
ncbi:Artemisinic aldehyde Delta(11(13)) reductase [Mycena sanguinolenta]|uniref:Artemisinic aldehyde Delta(11(13)) reductase n=1 Tax=Mycena sanguinolenta TaxID=230812 RepID=A0A8H6YTM3_9AGAR|nr:Artemisinic aldehyde Delta(11(13)) reductase [Mycena sanguinolenta]